MTSRCACLCATALLAGCWLDRDFKHDGPTAPVPLDDGWAIDTPESVGLDASALRAIHAELLDPERFVGALGFLVAKDGKLVFETYLRDVADRDHVHHLQSTTKSITSLVFGIGRDQGWVPPVETTYCSILPDACQGLDARKQTITLHHLLTMRSGLTFSNDDFSVEMWVGNPADPIRHILAKPLYADPGTAFDYRDADPQLVTYAMERLAGRSEESVAAQFLFGPLGIRDWHWDRGGHGESMGAHGLHLRPRDVAKVGQLMVDGGTFHGEPIVSTDWYATSTAEKVSVEAHPRLGYGYYWWLVPEAQGFSTWGHGGQFAIVIPAKRLVMVLVSMPDSDGLHGGVLEDFVDLTRPLWATP